MVGRVKCGAATGGAGGAVAIGGATHAFVSSADWKTVVSGRWKGSTARPGSDNGGMEDFHPSH